MELTLNSGHIVLIDDADYELVSGLTWHVQASGRRRRIKGAYAFVKQSHPLWGKYKRIAMHRLLMNFPDLLVDHVNCNPLDNRRSNLRLATDAQNIWNSGLRYNNKYGIKGIQKEITGRFVARMEHYGERIYLGIYDTPEEAGAAYAAAVIKYKGEFARLK